MDRAAARRRSARPRRRAPRGPRGEDRPHGNGADGRRLWRARPARGGLRGRATARSSPSRPCRGRPSERTGYDWLVLTSRNGVEALFARLEGRAPAGRRRRPRHGGGAARARGRAGARRRPLDAGGARERSSGPAPAGCCSREPRARGTCSPASSAPMSCRCTGRSSCRPERFPDADLVSSRRPRPREASRRSARDAPCVSIGPVTTARRAASGCGVVAEAESHDRDGLVRAVKLVASRPGSSPS